MTLHCDLTLPVADQRLKSATRDMVAAAGGVEVAGEIVGLGRSRMSDCQNPHTEAFLTIQQARRLEDVTRGYPGWPAITRALARAAGGVFVPLPDAAGAGEWHSAMGRLAKEAGDITARICAALADDGHVSAREAEAIQIECDEAIEALVAVKRLALRGETQ